MNYLEVVALAFSCFLVGVTSPFTRSHGSNQVSDRLLFHGGDIVRTIHNRHVHGPCGEGARHHRIRGDAHLLRVRLAVCIAGDSRI